LIKAWTCQVRNSIGNPSDGEPPATADYDMWLGCFQASRKRFAVGYDPAVHLARCQTAVT
jgi:hypothetical protein